MPQHSRPLPSQPTSGFVPPISIPPRPEPDETPNATVAEEVPPVARPTGLTAPSGAPWYRSESWLAFALAAFLPMVLAFVAPAAFKVPMLALCGALFATAMVLLVRRELGPREPASAPAEHGRGARRRAGATNDGASAARDS